MNLKMTIRKMLRSREHESIRDSMDRHKIGLQKLLFRQKYTAENLRDALIRIGIKQGDTVFIHASWRAFYNFKGEPQDVISILESLIGDSGTLAMPCYGNDRTFLDVNTTPSAAGYLSEVFRKLEGVIRSHCTHFSVAAKGQRAVFLTEEHELSKYGFDLHSPCYKLSQIPNAKILFLGLGAIPTKISIFHCAGAILYDTDPKIKALLSNHYKATLIDESGCEHENEMIIRIPGHGNDENVFRQIFKSIHNKKSIKVSNLDVVLIDANEALRAAVSYAKEGKYCYKNMKRL